MVTDLKSLFCQQNDADPDCQAAVKQVDPLMQNKNSSMHEQYQQTQKSFEFHKLGS